MVSATAFDTPKPDMTSMDNIKLKFNETLARNSTHVPQTFLNDQARNEVVNENGKKIRPFEFRRIGSNKN